jgi:hypothetical protein
MRKIISLICFLLPVLAFAEQSDTRPELRGDAPDRHVVVKGDTLWDISGKFFKDPWKWQYIWGMNKDAIKNPALIYPGDVIVLDRASGTLRVGGGPASAPVQSAAPVAEPPVNTVSSLEVVKLSPRIRESDSTHNAIQSIPVSAIGPFLTQPLVVEENALNEAPMLVGAREGRVMLSTHDICFVKGLPSRKISKWQVYRPGKQLIDPDTEELLGIEAIYLGDAEVTNFADISTATITRSVQEINKNDRLIEPSDKIVNAYVPHAPDSKITAKVISVYGGVSQAGKNTVITLNKGKRDRLEIGDVLALYHKGETVTNGDNQYAVPDNRYGLVLVFRVFDKVSYALVMQTSLPVQLLDRAQNP